MDTRLPIILPVDDDASVRQSTSRLLAAPGFETRVFDSAEALGASGCARTADCLVLDMQLPGVCVVEYRAALPRSRPPTVFITANDGPAAQHNTQRVGARGCLAKPFDGAAFLELVTRTTAELSPSESTSSYIK
jgi:FixJ family two-component response regulator